MLRATRRPSLRRRRRCAAASARAGASRPAPSRAFADAGRIQIGLSRRRAAVLLSDDSGEAGRLLDRAVPEDRRRRQGRAADSAADGRVGSGDASTTASRPSSRRTIDLLCGADTITLDAPPEVAFSIPIFPGGIGVAAAVGRAPTAARSAEPDRVRRSVRRGGRRPARCCSQARSRGRRRRRQNQWLHDRIERPESHRDRRAGSRPTTRASRPCSNAAPTPSSASARILHRRCATTGAPTICRARPAVHVRAAGVHACARRRRLPPAGRSHAQPVLSARPISTASTPDGSASPDENALTFFRWNALPD